MSQDVREHVDRALEQAVASDADLDEVEAIFDEAQDRLDEIRALRGEA